MSDYSRQEDFSVKDALTTGDPDKVIKGSEVDSEFDAIVTAVATKIDALSGHTTNDLVYLNSVGKIVDAGILYTDVAKISGTTFTGAVVLAADPTVDLGASTKQYVDDCLLVTQNTTGAVATTTSTIPNDDTIPQSTEGVQVITQAVTPKATTSRLIIDVVVNASVSVQNDHFAIALFQDTGANALAVAVSSSNFLANEMSSASLRFVMNAGTTSSTTFKVRAGMGSAGTLTINGASSARKYGGKLLSSITITEKIQ